MPHTCPACGNELAVNPLESAGESSCRYCGADVSEPDDTGNINTEQCAPAEPGTPADIDSGRKSPKAFPTIRQAILLLLAFVLISILLFVYVLIVDAIFNTNIADNTLTMDFLEILAAAIVLSWGFKKTGRQPGEVFPLKNFHSSLLPPMIYGIAGISIILSDFDNLLSSIMPPPQWFQEVLSDLISNPLQAVFTLIIVAPLIEETIFRGLILHGFLGNYPQKKAIVVSALLFAFCHLNPWQFTGAFVFGIFFAYLYIRTRSLLPCYIGHAIANSIPVMTHYLIGNDIPGFSPSPGGEVLFQPFWFDLIGLVLAVIGLRQIKKLLGKDPQRGSGIVQTPAN